MKRKLTIAATVAALALSTASHATIGTVDAVPAATLLIPYFEVDAANPQGQTTLFSVNNASPNAVLAHVTLWTDLALPTIQFDLYLTGYDVETINLRDVFNGVLPQTATSGQDPGDTISPTGSLSQDISIATCTGFLPPLPLAPNLVQDFGAAHRGAPSAVFGNQCAAQDLGDGLLRGYVTVDVVTQCGSLGPQQPGYFGSGGTGIAANTNVLWGDYFFVNPSQNFAQGDTAVHVEADATNPETNAPGEYTFYGRYVGWTAADNREPLATTFGVRFVTGGAFSGGTSLIGWRDTKNVPLPFQCPAAPGTQWYPLSQDQIVIFDEQENPVVPPPVVFFPPVLPDEAFPFPAATQKTQVGGPALPVPYDFGWLYLNLNDSTLDSGGQPPEDSIATQAWVSVVHDAEGRFSIGHSAMTYDNASNASHVGLGQ